LGKATLKNILITYLETKKGILLARRGERRSLLGEVNIKEETLYNIIERKGVS